MSPVAIVSAERLRAQDPSAEGRGAHVPSAPDFRIKGSAVSAVILERNGVQTRISGPVVVQNGDSLRVEVTLERAAPCMVLLLGEDGSEVVLQRPERLEPGVHYSSESARFDAAAYRGVILTGEPERVRDAAKSRRFEGANAISVRHE
jgi:hypothetical protein